MQERRSRDLKAQWGQRWTARCRSQSLHSLLNPLLTPNQRMSRQRRSESRKPRIASELILEQRNGRWDVLIRGLWENSTDCIIDVRLTDTDAASNRAKEPEMVLEQQEWEKRKYLQPCLEQRRHFTPFVASTDGMLGKEAQTLLKKLSARIAEKSGESYSHVCGAMKARMSIAIVRATHLCIRGSRIPTSQMSSRRGQWEDGAGLASFKF